MTEDAKKVWQVMKNDFGWSNHPKDFHLEYFEDIIKATKQALNIPTVVLQSEQEVCDYCNKDMFGTTIIGGRICRNCGKPKAK